MKKRLFSCLLAAFCLLATLAGCGKNTRVVGSCAGYDVFYEELRFVALSVREEAESGDEAGLEQKIAERFAADYAVFSVAKAYLPELSIDSPEIQDAATAAVKEAIESYGSKSAYRAFLKEHGLTEHLAKQLLARAELELRCKEKIEAELFAGTYLETETAFADWLQNGNLVRVRRILTETSEEAEEIFALLQSGKTPEEAAGAKLSNSFYLVRGYSDSSATEEIAFSLSAAHPISEIVPNQTGQYLIFIWEENDYETFGTYQQSTYFRNLRTEKYNKRKEQLFAAAAEKITFALNDAGKAIDLATLK